jgi:hypothetical protein
MWIGRVMAQVLSVKGGVVEADSTLKGVSSHALREMHPGSEREVLQWCPAGAILLRRIVRQHTSLRDRWVHQIETPGSGASYPA